MNWKWSKRKWLVFNFRHSTGILSAGAQETGNVELQLIKQLIKLYLILRKIRYLVSKQPFYITSYGELWLVSLSHHVILLTKLPRLHRAVCAYRCANGPRQRTIPYTVLGLTILAVVGRGHKFKAIELLLYCYYANYCQVQHTKLLHHIKERIILSCISLDIHQNKTHYIKWGLYILVYTLIFDWS